MAKFFPDFYLEVVNGVVKQYVTGVDRTLTQAPKPAVLEFPLSELEGRTFQIHVLPNDNLKLVPTTIDKDSGRCPVVIGGERCGERAGHEGKHCWGNGD
jgi:hypothetical protein